MERCRRYIGWLAANYLAPRNIIAAILFALVMVGFQCLFLLTLRRLYGHWAFPSLFSLLTALVLFIILNLLARWKK